MAAGLIVVFKGPSFAVKGQQTGIAEMNSKR